MISELKGDDFGVLITPQTRLVQWNGPQKVVFSYSMRGKAVNAHFATTKKGLRYLKEAIEDFCQWAFRIYQCPMIMAMIEKPSVVRLVKKCDFVYLLKENDISIYMRKNHG